MQTLFMMMQMSPYEDADANFYFFNIKSPLWVCHNANAPLWVCHDANASLWVCHDANANYLEIFFYFPNRGFSKA